MLALYGCGGAADGDTPMSDNFNLQIQVLSGNAVPTPITDGQIQGEVSAFRDREASGVDRIVLTLRNLSVDRPGYYRELFFEVRDFGINANDEFPLVDEAITNATPPASVVFVTDFETADPMGDNRYGWQPGTGSVRLVSFNGDRYTFELEDVRLRNSGYLDTGEIAVSGTLSFTAPKRD